MSTHLLKSFLIFPLLMLFLLLGYPQQALAADGNGLVAPAGAATLQGSVPIQGVAQHASFRKWQLDLLVNGDEKQANFVAVSDKMQATPGLLASLDTTRFPNGQHRLRLRHHKSDSQHHGNGDNKRHFAF